jgi:hypothetical protein
LWGFADHFQTITVTFRVTWLFLNVETADFWQTEEDRRVWGQTQSDNWYWGNCSSCRILYDLESGWSKTQLTGW